MISQLKAAAQIAEQSRFPIALTITPEGIEIVVTDLATPTVSLRRVWLCTWRDLDAGELTNMVSAALQAMKLDCELNMTVVTGLQFMPPAPRYLP